MWNSIGDKLDLESHNEHNHSRKITTNVYAALILLINFIASRLTFREKIVGWGADFDLYEIVNFVIFVISAVIVLGLFVAKYVRNDHEIDLALILVMSLLVLFVCL